MFEGSLVESQHLIHTNNRWTALVSLSVQLALAATLVVLPLLHPEVLPFSAPRISLVAPHPPAPPVQQTMRASAAPEDPRVYSPPTPGPIIMHPAEPIGPPPTGSSISSMPTGTSPGDPLASIGNSAPRVTVRPTPTESIPKTLKISTGVAQGLLLSPLRPSYPQIAIATRTQGTVVIHAIISRTGTVESAQVLSGPPLLQTAALDAVRQARYSPYQLNGQPVEIETTFSINFKLGD